MMGLDCRERLKGIQKDFAEKYVTALKMDPETFAIPPSVWEILSSTPHAKTLKPLPGCCGWVCGQESA